MRKILISILICLLLIGTAFFMVNGMNAIQVKGFKGIDEKDKELEQKILELSNVVSVTYTNTEKNLERAAETLTLSKTEYENQAILSNLNNSSYASQLEFYDIDYLWTKLGNYAIDENVEIRIDVVAGGTSNNLFDLNFSVVGAYEDVTDFIYDIENDSKLGFKIDKFNMGASGDGVSATFTCADIPLKLEKIDSPGTDEVKEPNTNTLGTNTTTNTSSGANTTTNTSNVANTTKRSTNTTNTSTKGNNTTTTNSTTTKTSY